MEPVKLANYPHCLTAPGATVDVLDYPGLYTVMSGFIAYRDGKKRNAYILRDEQGNLHACLNGWLTPFEWLSERLAQLQAAAQEEVALRAALRQAVGEQ